MRVITVVLSVIALVLGASTVASATQVRPLQKAHAHNDYEHERPLLDALDHGFTALGNRTDSPRATAKTAVSTGSSSAVAPRDSSNSYAARCPQRAAKASGRRPTSQRFHGAFMSAPASSNIVSTRTLRPRLIAWCRL